MVNAVKVKKLLMQKNNQFYQFLPQFLPIFTIFYYSLCQLSLIFTEFYQTFITLNCKNNLPFTDLQTYQLTSIL
jgi:hypothetical protein